MEHPAAGAAGVAAGGAQGPPWWFVLLRNAWLIVKTLVWIVMLDGVLEYLSMRHYNRLLRQIVVLLLGRDPAQPRLPESWEEWYYS